MGWFLRWSGVKQRFVPGKRSEWRGSLLGVGLRDHTSARLLLGLSVRLGSWGCRFVLPSVSQDFALSVSLGVLAFFRNCTARGQPKAN
jgi:hypothetical protein